MNQLFLFSGNSCDNSTVIPYLPIALDTGISSFRQWGAFVKEKCRTAASVRESVKRVGQFFLRSPKKSVRHASHELAMSSMTVWRVLRKRLLMKPYRLHLLQFLKPKIMSTEVTFASRCKMQWWRKVFLIVFCLVMSLRFISVGECTDWKSSRDGATWKGFPKDQFFLRNVHTKGLWASLFPWRHCDGNKLLEMLQTWLFPRLQEDEPKDFLMQQNGAPMHFRLDVLHCLNDVPPHRWIGRSVHEDLMFCLWPARSPDLTPCDYFLWVYVKEKVFVPSQPMNIPDMKNRITAAVETITPYLLSRIWQKLDYRLDVCRVTKSAHIEHL
jgi:hypothetical protein